MRRYAYILSAVCLALVTSAAGCNKAPEPEEQPVAHAPRRSADKARMSERGDTQSAAQASTQASTERPSSEKPADVDNDHGQLAVSSVPRLLIGTWVTRFVVEDKAFDTFVEANMLTAELAQSERQQWSDSTITLVFNSDGSFTWTEPDGNTLAGSWKIATSAAGRVDVVLASDQQVRRLVLDLDESGDEFSCEFAEDPYELLPLQRPFKFSRD